MTPEEKMHSAVVDGNLKEGNLKEGNLKEENLKEGNLKRKPKDVEDVNVYIYYISQLHLLVPQILFSCILSSYKQGIQDNL